MKTNVLNYIIEINFGQAQILTEIQVFKTLLHERNEPTTLCLPDNSSVN